jgi:hypothetical protein
VLEHVVDLLERATLELGKECPAEKDGSDGDGAVCRETRLSPSYVVDPNTTKGHPQTKPTFPPKFPYSGFCIYLVNTQTALVSTLGRVTGVYFTSTDGFNKPTSIPVT